MNAATLSKLTIAQLVDLARSRAAPPSDVAAANAELRRIEALRGRADANPFAA